MIMLKISIVSPVYNEEEGIEDFDNELHKIISTLAHKYKFEIIYVLDKSTDGSLAKLQKIIGCNSDVKVIALSRRFGHQISLVAGMDRSDGDAVIMMDSDLEHPPAIIPQLLGEFEKGYDIVHTRRIYNSGVSFIKKTTSRLFYKIMSAIASVRIDENSADFRLISKRVLKVMQNDIREQNQFLRGLFYWVGFNQTYVNFVSGIRSKGKSKYNLRRLFNFAALGITSFSKAPLKLAIYIGLISSSLSIMYCLFAVLEYFFVKLQPQGWTSLIAAVTFLGGLQLIFIGVIGEYVGAIFDEVKKRPLYIIEDEYGSQN
jgi:dolichol-phosphate mannosyltransferase